MKLSAYKFSIAVLFLSFTVFLLPKMAHAGTDVAVASPVMQCMVKCIKQEGKTAAAKSMCKLRCADVPMPELNSGGRDCMAVYKKCNRTCKKNDKACRRSCKGQLMQCK